MSSGYCHFNDSGKASSFTISFGQYQLTVRQEPANRVLGHGAVVWDAAVIFLKYLETSGSKDFDTTKVSGKKVLELGAGTGLAGISLMLRGAHVTFTDMKKVVDTLTDKNVKSLYTQFKQEFEAQNSTITLLKPDVIPIDWTEECEELRDQTFDYILLTDCVFSEELTEPLVSTILRYTNPKTTVIVCHEIRDENANAAFVARMSQNYKIKRIPKNKLHPEYSNDFVELFTAKPIK